MKVFLRIELTTTTELGLELLDATSSVDEALFTGVSRVRIRSDVADHDLVLNTIDDLCLTATHGGAGQIFGACGDVDECDRVELWMDVSFHGKFLSRFGLSPDAL